MALALLVLLPCQPSLQPVSRLQQALAGQGFQLAVADGGAAVLTASDTGERKSHAVTCARARRASHTVASCTCFISRCV